MIDTHWQTIPVGYQKHTEHLQQVYVCERVCSYSDVSTRVCTCENDRSSVHIHAGL